MSILDWLQLIFVIALVLVLIFETVQYKHVLEAAQRLDEQDAAYRSAIDQLAQAINSSVEDQREIGEEAAEATMRIDVLEGIVSYHGDLFKLVSIAKILEAPNSKNLGE